MHGSEHPLRQFDANFPRAENRAIGLLQDETQAPGGEQRIQRPPVEMLDQHPLHQHSQRPGSEERQYHREKKIAAKQARKVRLKEIRCHPGNVGAKDHELAMRHVDHAHLAEDDCKTERHQHVDGKQDQARETLHDEDGAQITNRVVAEHRCPPSGKVPRRRYTRRGGLERGLTIHARERPAWGESAIGPRVLIGSPWGTDRARPDRRSRRSGRTGHRASLVRPVSSTKGDGFHECGRNLPAHP
ncbi:hypothetical protein GALL_488240 [mine drainage metagenome]|uniref:Uncharacterized protein n=1 Tax=mine drainage metagenome TaxID=410659 RepID=A0A1J5PDZ3_9ZZZZ